MQSGQSLDSRFPCRSLAAARRTNGVLLTALLCLLLAAQLQAGLGTLGIFWWSIPSWDNPATHGFETRALLTPTFNDPNGPLREQVVAAAIESRDCNQWSDQPSHPQTPCFSFPITRSPPAA